MPRKRPALRRAVLLAAVLALCAWIATWIPALRHFLGSDARNAPESRPASAPEPEQPHERAPAPTPLPEPAQVDRLLLAEPALREALTEWRFDEAFRLAREPLAFAVVAGQLDRAVEALRAIVREGRILEAEKRVAGLARSRDDRCREALARLARGLALDPRALEAEPPAGATSRPQPSPFAKGTLVRFARDGEPGLGRIEVARDDRVLVRLLSPSGTTFPEVDVSDIEPVDADAAEIERLCGDALRAGRLRTAALWLACGEMRGATPSPALRELRASLVSLTR